MPVSHVQVRSLQTADEPTRADQQIRRPLALPQAPPNIARRPSFSVTPHILPSRGLIPVSVTPRRPRCRLPASSRMPVSTDTPARTPNIRAALNPATAKPPAECPHCGSKRVTRKGIRKKKLERVQLWQCARCRRVATPAPAHVRNTTYPPRFILDALTTYNLGHSLAETAERVHARTARTVPLSTLSRWITAYKPFTSYAGLRP